MTVSTRAVASCTVSTQDLVFPDFTGTEAAATTSITVNCTMLSDYAISVGAGIHGSSSTGRMMSDGAGHSLSYELYSDSGHTAAWGDDYGGEYTFGGAASVHDTGTGGDQVRALYGKVFSQSIPAVGSYVDVVDVTVHY